MQWLLGFELFINYINNHCIFTGLYVQGFEMTSNLFKDSFTRVRVCTHMHPFLLRGCGHTHTHILIHVHIHTYSPEEEDDENTSNHTIVYCLTLKFFLMFLVQIFCFSSTLLVAPSEGILICGYLKQSTTSVFTSSLYTTSY